MFVRRQLEVVEFPRRTDFDKEVATSTYPGPNPDGGLKQTRVGGGPVWVQLLFERSWASAETGDGDVRSAPAAIKKYLAGLCMFVPCKTQESLRANDECGRDSAVEWLLK